jgi:hypothetical protein
LAACGADSPDSLILAGGVCLRERLRPA